MKNKFFILITILSISFFMTACGGNTEPSANNSAVKTNSNANANANAPANTAENVVATTKKPEAQTTDNAPTLAPVVAAYYEAIKKGDDATLKKLFSAETLKSFEADMKADKITSLSKFLTENDPPSDKPFEIRNEKIQGDSAIAEIKGGVYANWTPFKFVKENGEWKMTNESPDTKEVKEAANSANTAK